MPKPKGFTNHPHYAQLKALFTLDQLKEWDDEDFAEVLAKLQAASPNQEAPPMGSQLSLPAIRIAMFETKGKLKDPEKNTVGAETRDGKVKYKYPALKTWWPEHRAVWREHQVDVDFGCYPEGDIIWYEVTFTSMEDGSQHSRRIPFNYTGSNPQDEGGWLTYCFRYVYLMACGLVPDADDDANEATSRARSTPAKRPSAKKSQGKTQGPLAKIKEYLPHEFGESPDELLNLFEDFIAEVKRNPNFVVNGTTPDELDRMLGWINGAGKDRWSAFYAKSLSPDVNDKFDEHGVP